MRVEKIIKFRKGIFKGLVSRILMNKGVDIPPEVQIGKDVKFPHNSVGTVIHNNTTIESNAKIYQNVTLGRADIHLPMEKSKMKGILIKEGAIICARRKSIV